MTTQTQTEFLAQHAPDGVMTPQQAATFLELAQGDTGTLPEKSSAPIAAPEATAPTTTTQAAEPEQAVILAKDGKHTIPYEKLAEAREAAGSWKAAAENAQQELAALKAQADARAEAGAAPTKTDAAVATATAAIEQGIDPEIFGDFSEHDLAKGIQTLIANGVAQATAQLRGELSSVVAPIQNDKAQAAVEAHYGAIYAKHPDADSVAESAELQSWIDSQPSFARAGYLAARANGSTAEVIELFDAFKAATGAGAKPGNAAAAARAVIDRTREPVPFSLTDIAGGRAGATSRFEALADMSPIALAEAMQEMTESQRQEFLNRGI